MRKLLLVFLTILLFTGCQAKGHKSTVMQKDMAQMIEKAAVLQVDSKQNIENRVNAPKTFQVNTLIDNFSVTANAPVFVPSTDKFPILQVKPGDMKTAEEMSFESTHAAHVMLRKGLNSVLYPEKNSDSMKTQHITKTPLQAYEEALDTLRQINSPMIICSFSLVDDSSTEGDKIETSSYAYAFHCTRVVDDIPCALLIGNTYTSNENGEVENTWPYESLIMLVNDEGVIALDWRAPLEIVDAKVEECLLLPFSEIEAIFKKMIMVTYNMVANQAETLMLEISEVRLELQRVSEIESAENGLLIPAWNFYGTRTSIYDNNSEQDKTGIHILLCLNAIDGSVIDISTGQ